MAIKIPIVTVFENKGIRDAERQLSKVSGNFQNLGRNFAIAGAALAGVTVALGSSIKAASNLEAEFEGVNQVFGEAAASVQAFAAQAATSAGLTETAALQASKVFGLFATGAGMAEKDAAKFATTMVQLAGDLGSFNDVPTEEALAAIQSGLQGQSEPLRKFGVFLDDARLRAEALNLGIYNGKGPLTQQQKMMAAYESILKQTNIQQGDFVKYADTYGNQLKTLEAEFANLSAEVGQQLLPVMAEIIPVIRELVAEIGPKLKEAMAQVDWAGLATAFGNLLTFLVQNLDTIIKVAGALWIMNTAYNAVRVTVGLYNAVAMLLNGTLFATATTAPAAAAGVTGVGTASTIAAGKVGLLSTAMRLVPWAALATGIFYLAGSYTKHREEIEKTTPALSEFDKEFEAVNRTVGDVYPLNAAIDSLKVALFGASGEAKTLATNLNNIPKNVNSTVTITQNIVPGKVSVLDAYAYNKKTGQPTPGVNPFAGLFGPGPGPDLKGTGTAKPKLNAAKQLLADFKKEQRQARVTQRLMSQKGFTQGLADMIVGKQGGLKTARGLLDGTIKGAKNLKNQYAKTAAGIAEANKAAEAVVEEAAGMTGTSTQAAARARMQAEQDILNQRKENYKSFVESVKSTFGQIKESILGAFKIDDLGSSTNSIIRNMNKLLTKTRDFAKNISSLAGMGLNADLLQQIIQKGPVAGAALAEALVAGGTAALTEINTGYTEMGFLSSQIAQSGANALFGTQTQQNIYNIEVNGGLATGASIGQAIVEAVRSYERTSGAVWARA